MKFSRVRDSFLFIFCQIRFHPLYYQKYRFIISSILFYKHYYFRLCWYVNQTIMTVTKTTKKNIQTKAKGKLLTKKEKAYKRVSHIKKVIENKRKAKIQSRKTKVSLKRRQNQQAEQQNIELVAPQQNFNLSSNQQEINILNILGLNDGNMAEEVWQKKLEQKLKQVNEKSIDNPEVRRVYGEIGKIFSTYRSGKVPKAFKVIPNLDKWREVLQLTHPEKWTPQAMYQAVNIFASNFDPIRAEEFYKEYLVPAVKNDLQKNKKLNYHYYESLIKALYKTNAWFKGVLFQFCDKNTNLREVKVIESLLSKISIPVISSSVALIKMTEMAPSSPILHYLKALVSKNYSFPKKVLTVLTNYLIQFQKVDEQLPVLWHQFFLTIVKQYGSSLDEMSKASLAELAKKRSHKLITPEILKELN